MGTSMPGKKIIQAQLFFIHFIVTIYRFRNDYLLWKGKLPITQSSQSQHQWYELFLDGHANQWRHAKGLLMWDQSESETKTAFT